MVCRRQRNADRWTTGSWDDDAQNSAQSASKRRKDGFAHLGDVLEVEVGPQLCGELLGTDVAVERE